MGRTAEFEAIETSRGWMVSTPPTMSATGKRTRKYFKSKTKAVKFAEKLRAAHKTGVRGSTIPALLALQASEAVRILEGTGISLVEAARIARNSASSPAAMETFQERYERIMPIGETIWSDKYAKDMEKIPKWVGKEIMSARCGTLTEEIFREAIRKNRSTNAGTVKMTMLRVMAIFNDRERGVTKRGPVDILTVTQAAKLLRVCERKEERWTVALLLFAGIRPDSESGEISRLEWSAFNGDDAYIADDVSKTRGDRHVAITPRLRRLLRGHPKDGPVAPSGWKKAWQRIRREAGISHLTDVTRHTFASNFLAAFGEHATKQAMGHTANSQTLFRHYRRAITAKDGERFFR